jgi:glycosyltransferase involved in cell wall biosynthesis
MSAPAGITVVVPVHNGASWLRDVVTAIEAEANGRPMEIVIVDDASTDDSRALALSLATHVPLRVLDGDGRGPAAAINLGVRDAQFSLICQIDQDVVVQKGWLSTLLDGFTDPRVAAAQGHYVPAPDAPLAAQIAGLDLEQRYAALAGTDMSHVCTGNTIYRASALTAIGGFDETFGYGYDNDTSYRLRAAGYRLLFCRDARSVHHWRGGLRGYCAQQYGLGYGRLDLLSKHPRRVTGDSVSPLGMMLHPVVMCAAIVSTLVAAAAGLSNAGWWFAPLALSAILVSVLAVERLSAGLAAARRSRRLVPLLFPLFHLVRDVVWVGAILMWCGRRLARIPTRPAHSMTARTARSTPVCSGKPSPRAVFDDARLLILIPAHNESQALPQVIEDVRRHHRHATILVIDDGSSDSTARVAEELGVNWIQLPERMGIGSAMRAGLRYARRRRADVVVRLDGDGQHGAEDIAALIAPVAEGRADVVLGSRYIGPDDRRAGPVRIVQRVLGFCLTTLTGQPVTDPTSGFCAFGPAAVRLLCDHHPTGYPEPELRLLLSRCGIRVVETPMRSRSRLAGRSSLTPWRLAAAGARVALAMVIVPLRHARRSVEHD